MYIKNRSFGAAVIEAQQSLVPRVNGVKFDNCSAYAEEFRRLASTPTDVWIVPRGTVVRFRDEGVRGSSDFQATLLYGALFYNMVFEHMRHTREGLWAADVGLPIAVRQAPRSTRWIVVEGAALRTVRGTGWPIDGLFSLCGSRRGVRVHYPNQAEWNEFVTRGLGGDMVVPFRFVRETPMRALNAMELSLYRCYASVGHFALRQGEDPSEMIARDEYIQCATALGYRVPTIVDPRRVARSR